MKSPSVAISIVVLSAVLAAPAFAKDKVPSGYMEQLKLAIRLISKADAEMYQNMAIIADELEAFRSNHGHFPELGPEQNEFAAKLASVLKRNPYEPRTVDVHTGQIIQAEKVIQLRFLVDSALSQTLVDEALKNPPASWRAEPGTITIIHNNEDRFLIWAASADGGPVRYHKSANMGPRIVFRDLNPATIY